MQPKQRFTLVALLGFVAAICVAFAFAEPDRREPESAVVAATSEASLEPPSRLRVGTYNLRNFHNENRFSGKGKFVYKGPKPEKSKLAMYRIICEVRPDILAVQEIGGEAWLDELATALERRGLSFPYRTWLEGDDRFHRLAVLSRIPFDREIKISAHRTLSRGLLGVSVALAEGKTLYIYNVHLKSKVASNRDDPDWNRRRLDEARAVRRLIDYRILDEKAAERIPYALRSAVPDKFKKATPELFLLVGDFNDVPESKPLAPLEADAFARALPAKDSAGGVKTYFNPKRGYFHTLDRIFVSPEIFKKYYLPDSARIADFPGASTASDHRLVFADFDFSENRSRNEEK